MMGRIWDKFRRLSLLEMIYFVSLCCEMMCFYMIYRWFLSSEFMGLLFIYNTSFLGEGVTSMFFLSWSIIVGLITWICKDRSVYVMFIFYSIISLVYIIRSSQVLKLEMSERLLGELRESMKSVEYSDTEWGQQNSSSATSTFIWHNLQNSLQCCGLDSWKDWTYPPKGADDGVLPNSCCSPADRVISAEHQYCKEKIYYSGCLQKAKDFASGWYVDSYFMQLSAALLIQAIIKLALDYRKRGWRVGA